MLLYVDEAELKGSATGISVFLPTNIVLNPVTSQAQVQKSKKYFKMSREEEKYLKERAEAYQDLTISKAELLEMMYVDFKRTFPKSSMTMSKLRDRYYRKIRNQFDVSSYG